MADLTLPGDIPGLLRRCSPVVVAEDLHEGKAMTLHALGNGFASGAVDGLSDVCAGHVASLALDLTDATGRAHAAWWLVLQVFFVHDPERWSWVGERGEREWGVVRCYDGTDARAAEQQWWAPFRDCGVGVAPSLADLDPSDPRTLADGSPWVDAEALRRVVLHVAGREVTRG